MQFLARSDLRDAVFLRAPAAIFIANCPRRTAHGQVFSLLKLLTLFAVIGSWFRMPPKEMERGLLWRRSGYLTMVSGSWWAYCG